MKIYKRVDVQIHKFLISALDEWSASPPGRFTPENRALDAHWIGRWDHGPVWTTKRGEKSCPYQNLNSKLPAVQPVASRFTDCSIPAPEKMNK
jgi:hypothetical protein